MDWNREIANRFGSVTTEQKQILLKIAKEVDWIDIKPYSHNIVSLQLRSLNEKGFDDKMMDDVIKMFHLHRKGW